MQRNAPPCACVSEFLRCIMWLRACVCVGVHNSSESIPCKCTLREWVFKSTLRFFCAHVCLLINGNLLLMFIIMTLFMDHFLCVSVCDPGQRTWVPWVAAGCCPPRSRSLWSLRVWSSPPLTRRNCCCSTRTPSSAESTKRYNGTLNPCRFSSRPHLNGRCSQLHWVLSENQRRIVGVVWKLLSIREELSLHLPLLLDCNQVLLNKKRKREITYDSLL